MQTEKSCNISKLTRYHTGTTLVDCNNDASLSFFSSLNGLKYNHAKALLCRCIMINVWEMVWHKLWRYWKGVFIFVVSTQIHKNIMEVPAWRLHCKLTTSKAIVRVLWLFENGKVSKQIQGNVAKQAFGGQNKWLRFQHYITEYAQGESSNNTFTYLLLNNWKFYHIFPMKINSYTGHLQLTCNCLHLLWPQIDKLKFEIFQHDEATKYRYVHSIIYCNF